MTQCNNQIISSFSSGKNQAARDIAGRHAINHVWDQSEPKLLVCEARELATDEKSKKQKDAYNEQVQLTKATMKDTVRDSQYFFVKKDIVQV